MLEVDACSVLTGCLGGTAQEVLRAAKITDKGLNKNVEKLKEAIITKFMGDLTQFDLKAKAWSSKQKETECARDWAARLQMIMFYYMRKEILDSDKYKETLSRGKYANTFSGEDLTHYDWATTEYWKQMLIYIHDETATAPWHSACWERYEQTPVVARRSNRSMARSEGGPNLEEDKSVKGRKKIRDGGPRVLMGFVARPERAAIAPKRRELRPERTTGVYLPELTRRDNFVEDMPPGAN